MRSLNQGDIHCWWTTLDEPLSDHLRRQCLAVLSGQEMQRYRAYYFDHHREAYLQSHGFLRWVLAQYLPCSPELLEFDVGANGKPSLKPVGKENIIPLQFNLSHSKKGVLVGVSGGDCMLGVDTESHEAARDVMAIAQRQFAEVEFNYLQALPQSRLIQGFYSFWTLKEAYVKAQGKGLLMPLDRFFFDLQQKPLRFVCMDAEHKADHAFFWQLQFDPDESSAIAALCKTQEKPKSIKLFRAKVFGQVETLVLDQCLLYAS